MSPDPRVAMGYDVEPEVFPPFEVMPASDTGGQLGGTLDHAIIARTKDGRRIVIGEIWAACPGAGGTKVRIDAREVARRIAETLNGGAP